MIFRMDNLFAATCTLLYSILRKAQVTSSYPASLPLSTGWPECSGIRGRIRLESVAGLDRNTQWLRVVAEMKWPPGVSPAQSIMNECLNLTGVPSSHPQKHVAVRRHTREKANP